VVALGVGVIIAGIVVVRDRSIWSEARFGAERTAWQAEKDRLEAALAVANARPKTVVVAAPESAPVVVASKPEAAGIVVRLCEIASASVPANARTLRRAVYCLEQLVDIGPDAVPAIHDYLGRFEDLDLDVAAISQGRRGGAGRGRLPAEFVLPPTVRFGLFDALRQIGGVQAEAALADAMARTGRGIELAYLARTLQEIAPGKYRDPAVAAAREMLLVAAPPASNHPLDRDHRDYLFGVLTFFGDTSFTGSAQAQLVSADGQVDRSSLRYLQLSLGAQAIPIVAQAYQDPRLTDPATKEPLARLALAFVGTDAQANQLYHLAINDPALPKDARRNLIEDLNQDGFADRRNLTANDLPLIQSRIALIEQSAPTAMDTVNAKAFAEAYKDLQNMQKKILEATSGSAQKSAAGNPPGQ
jgi:hypothetical protein